MARVFKVLLILVGLVFVLMLGSGLAIKTILSSGASEMLREEISSRFPVEVSLGDGDFDLKQWFLLRPSITIRDLSIGNPEGFSDQPMIVAGEITAQVPLTTLFSDRPRVEHITITSPSVRIETNKFGRNNLASLAPESSESEPAAGEAGESAEARVLAIDRLTITDGSLEIVDLASGQTLLLESVNLSVTDFSTTSMFNLELSARPFGGDESMVSFSGRAGPFLQTSFPAEGAVSIAIAPTEIPEEIRVRMLGNGLRDPGVASVLRAEAEVTGDLMATLTGKGRLQFEDFEFGRDAEHRLELDGGAPVDLTVRQALNSPVLDMAAHDADLDLGDGEYRGDLQLAVGLTGTSGAISGSIQNVDIDQMLSTFTESSGQIYGKAAIPSFRLRFAGANGDEMLNSLQGNGTVTLDEGRITFMDTISSVLDTAGAILKLTGLTRSNQPAEGGEVKAPEGQTAFTTLSGDVSIQNRRADIANVTMKSPSGDVTGGGYYTFDYKMDFDLIAHVTGEVADALGGKPDAEGIIRAAVPFDVTGTFADPIVRPEVAPLAVGVGMRILEGFLGGGKKGEATGEQQP